MLVRMSEEDPDYEGKWPEGDAMSERVLVPREPTAKMVLAAFDAITNASGEGMICARWRCMLDAAPAAPQQAEPVAQIGWADEFGNLFPMGAWQPAQRTHHDSHKAAWRAVYLHPPAAPQQVEPVAWRDHVEQRLHNWRQRTMNRSGDRLALDDMMSKESIDDLIDYVCDEWSDPAAPQQAEPVAQIGWSDEFGNLFPMGAWKPTQRTHHDSHKTAWRAVYLHPPADEVQRLRDALRVILEADWTSDRIRNIARKALEGGA